MQNRKVRGMNTGLYEGTLSKQRSLKVTCNAAESGWAYTCMYTDRAQFVFGTIDTEAIEMIRTPMFGEKK